MFLTINDDGQMVLQNGDEDIVVTNRSQLAKLLNGESCMCSSSLDFPDEYTNDPAVIQLCDEVRNPTEHEPMTHEEMKVAIANIKYGENHRISMSQGLLKGPVISMLSDVQELINFGQNEEAQDLVNLIKFAILQGETV